MITSLEKDPASPTKNSSSKKSLQISISPKNSRAGSSLIKNTGSKTARASQDGFNFKLENMIEEVAEIRGSTPHSLKKEPSTSRF